MTAERSLGDILHAIARSESMVPDPEARDDIEHAAKAIDRYVNKAQVVIVAGADMSWEEQQLHEMSTDLAVMRSLVSDACDRVEDMAHEFRRRGVNDRRPPGEATT
jgi:hypothetical protein